MANTTTINSELFQKLLAQSQYAAYENSLARAIAQVFDYPMNAGKVVQVPVWAGITAAKPGEGVAPDAADTNTTSKDITLIEHVVRHVVTDFLRDSAQEDVISGLATQAGMALAESLDNDLFALFADNSITQSVGTAGSVNSVEDLLKAAAILRGRKLTGPFYAVMHPSQAYQLKKELATNGGSNIPALSSIGESVLGNFYIGSVAGITVLESALVDIDNSADATGAVFSPYAFGVAQRGSIVMETQREAAARATEVIMTAVAGTGILRPEYAVKVIGDTTL
jgi:N4-gp56 family major capsid protein